RRVHILHSPEDVDAAEIVREPLWNNLKHEHGPFDIIGDVHGCFDELVELLAKLGYEINRSEGEMESGNEGKCKEIQSKYPAPPSLDYSLSHPTGRKLIFVGDLVDRGPNIPRVLKLVMS